MWTFLDPEVSEVRRRLSSPTDLPQISPEILRRNPQELQTNPRELQALSLVPEHRPDLRRGPGEGRSAEDQCDTASQVGRRARCIGAAIVLAVTSPWAARGSVRTRVPAPAGRSSCGRPAIITHVCCWPGDQAGARRPGASAGSDGSSPKPTGASRAAPRSTDLERSQRGIRDQAQAVLVGDISQPPCQGILGQRHRTGHLPAARPRPEHRHDGRRGSVTFSPRYNGRTGLPDVLEGDGEHTDSGFRPGAGPAATAGETRRRVRPATRRWSGTSASSPRPGHRRHLLLHGQAEASTTAATRVDRAVPARW